MTAKRILLMVLVVTVVALWINQWRLQRAVGRMSTGTDSGTRDNSTSASADDAEAKLRQAETRYHEAQTQLRIAEQKLATANAQLAQLDQRVQQLESGRPARTGIIGFSGRDFAPAEPPGAASTVKRSWGPEQAAGEPDTMQSGDIPTAWAPREQDGGEEWLKLDYETSVDIAEVRVRETHNPGAISKVTAFLANGSEVTLWEGVEPKAMAPVEMSFAVPSSVNAKSVKVYLDTTRVPGWNEIDAVQIIGRDGSQQWAKQATASSTYAEPRVANRDGGLERF